MEVISTQQSVIVHTKELTPVAVTIYNGKPTMYLLKEVERKDVEDFFEVNQLQEYANSNF